MLEDHKADMIKIVGENKKGDPKYFFRTSKYTRPGVKKISGLLNKF